jgi:hypothetical protein
MGELGTDVLEQGKRTVTGTCRCFQVTLETTKYFSRASGLRILRIIFI